MTKQRSRAGQARGLVVVLAAVVCAVALVSVQSASSVQSAAAGPQTAKVKALVGGTLIDGYGGAPIRNSAVRGDVLRYIALLQHVDIVVKRGNRVK